MKTKHNVVFAVSFVALVATTAAQENHKHTVDANGNRAGHATDLSSVKSAASLVGSKAADFTTVDARGKPARCKEAISFGIWAFIGMPRQT